MKKPPLVSIILTLYEIKYEYLDKCINSILTQTYKNIEIIAINDCSPAKDYNYLVKKSNKIKLFKNPINLGMNKTVNKAFKMASGDYIVRLGSDDIFDSTLIEKEVTMLEKNKHIGAVCCELQRFGDKTQHIKRPKVWSLEGILFGRKINGAGYAGGMMFRRELLDKISINESYRMCEDFDFHLQILEHMPIMSIHEVLYYYRSHKTNLCKTVKDAERINYIRTILKEHKNIYILKNRKIPQ